ncbi:GntR family transcriptional regulator [Corynebacterium alimapuense]|uniref:GntR family transcriptional regulator n=1 Tax=Corynebacterium alimapuense TaxID=1576874 RepID=A0A3M8K4B1_9CORY|nr:GntR family transcriptional regulator [Corynebacterium alimapuense]RNE48063.1 GntR family transcriptional regulator [Corynebacterium alimapuense]
MDNSAAPLFHQIATLVEDSILEGSLAVGDRVPSTTELAAFHSINPATALKGIGMLTESGIVCKQRGIGMFVAAGAREQIISQRMARLAEDYLVPLIDEVVKLDLSRTAVHSLIDAVAESRGLYR